MSDTKRKRKLFARNVRPDDQIELNGAIRVVNTVTHNPDGGVCIACLGGQTCGFSSTVRVAVWR